MTPPPTNKPQVAICQPSIILGGRLRVILGMVEILNRAGIVPDILTTRLAFDPAQVADKYGRPLQVRFRLLPRIPGLPMDSVTVLFNAALRAYGRKYDLLINTGNSLIFLPSNKQVLTYMFFPRKARLMAAGASIHLPEKRLSPWSRLGLQRIALRPLYRLSKPNPAHTIVCMTQFTRDALREVYDLPADLPVVYPPVDMSHFRTNHRDRTSAIVSVGRFTPDKRQLEQIQLAQKLPRFPFHIVGFANDNPYYRQCHRYVEKHRLTNVHLHPDAPFAEMLSLLQSARYFLHTLINEPFGITAVQAIAAGCLPIVHDSGGQRETVPLPELRYRDLAEVPAILDRLERMGEAARRSLVRQLQEHAAANFDESVFARRMQAILAPYLGREGGDAR